MLICSVPGCEQPHKAHGYCNAHASRHWRRIRSRLCVLCGRDRTRGSSPASGYDRAICLICQVQKDLTKPHAVV